MDWKQIERIAMWCLGVLVAFAAILFILLVIAHASDASELLFPPGRKPPVHHHTRGVASDPIPVTPRPVVSAPRPPTPEPRVARGDHPVGSVQSRIAAAWPGDDSWALHIVDCETGGTFDPTIAGQGIAAGHYGLWQFDLGTWAEVGGVGNPINASVEEQTARAWALYVKPDGGAGRWECK